MRLRSFSGRAGRADLVAFPALSTGAGSGVYEYAGLNVDENSETNCANLPDFCTHRLRKSKSHSSLCIWRSARCRIAYDEVHLDECTGEYCGGQNLAAAHGTEHLCPVSIRGTEERCLGWHVRPATGGSCKRGLSIAPARRSNGRRSPADQAGLRAAITRVTTCRLRAPWMSRASTSKQNCTISHVTVYTGIVRDGPDPLCSEEAAGVRDHCVVLPALLEPRPGRSSDVLRQPSQRWNRRSKPVTSHIAIGEQRSSPSGDTAASSNVGF